MAIQVPSYTDPSDGQVYTNLYATIAGSSIDLINPEQSTIILGLYASAAAANARKAPRFLWPIRMGKYIPIVGTAPTGTWDVSDVAAVFGAPVGGATATAQFNALKTRCYAFLRAAAADGRLGMDLSNASDV